MLLASGDADSESKASQTSFPTSCDGRGEGHMSVIFFAIDTACTERAHTCPPLGATDELAGAAISSTVRPRSSGLKSDGAAAADDPAGLADPPGSDI